MTRFDPIYRDTKPIHERTQDGLYEVVRRLSDAIEDGGEPDASTTADCIAILSAARQDVERCSDSIEDLVMRQNIADFRLSRHENLIHWINEVSVALKLLDVEGVLYRLLTLDKLEQGKSLTKELDSCRERVRWDR